jgi:murein DD-endopeptidase MepM/ murein hydrolase activator NlpD
MTNAHRDLATPELWNRSLERSRRRRELLPKARRENNRRKHVSAALATAVVAGPGAPLAAAQVSGDVSTAIAAQSPANRAIEIREGGLPLRVGSQGELVAHVQAELGVAADGVFGPKTDAAVRKYQLSAGLDVDGIVGPVTWSALFEQAGAGGGPIGGSNVPPAVKQEVEQRLQQAGAELEVQGDTGAGTQVGGQLNAAPPAATTPTTQPNTTVPTSDVPAGGSCGSATISNPVRGTVSSDFGPRGGRNHDGIDIAAPTGTPVRAAACGTVSLAGQQSGYGNIVCVTHTSQFSTCYAHLSRFGVSNGAQVQQGQVIGYVGCTGNCTGPHLHFETRVNGQAQNPRTYLAGGSIPGKRATVAGASSSAGKTSSTGSTEVVTDYGSGSTMTTTGAAAPAAPAAEGVPAGTTAAEGVPAEGTQPEALVVESETTAPAEVAPQPIAVEAQTVAPTEVAAEPVAAEVAAPAEVATQPIAVEAQTVAPAEVAAEPVAVEAQAAAPAEVAAEPVAVEVAAPAAVTPQPTAVEAQTVAPTEVAAEPVAVEVAAPAEAAAPAADQAQVDVGATAAVQ